MSSLDDKLPDRARESSLVRQDDSGPGDGARPADGGGDSTLTARFDEVRTTRQISQKGTFVSGQVIGERYQVAGWLGEGGMGEVWQSFDLKLRVEVALKALRREVLANARRRDLLRKEVRSAREVVSPNVCRVFDLVEADGQELVSMEYIDGETLTEVMEARGPLDLREASEIAAQLLAGLEAIHEAGLVHRDLKPDNIMITRTGRVVVMDFGVAKGVTEEPTGTVSGTPVYMAPEQTRGDAIDARTDVFAAGVVLAELVNPEGGRRKARESVWEGIRHVPPRLPDGPWQVVLRRAVAADRDERYDSAFAFARALEDVTLRVDGAEDKHPYPGLSAFTEEIAEFFFGREAEVETVWTKLQRPHLLALIGPSGAGKSSFLRAGLLPAKPEGWKHLICQPGEAPFRALGQALVPEFSGDEEAIRELLSIDDPEIALRLIARWRSRADEAVLVVDQFEELFTLNPSHVQERFAALLGSLPLEADIRVLLSMRDDFLFRCHEFAALAPLFSDLTPIGAPTGAAMRRALVQPALACGYRFEDDSIVDEMLGEVASERGALPLLAFAAARLWEKRDRETGTLTREAYEEIGGVSGALARHAEATLEALGESRLEMVREVFRNLVTADGTRATREMEELLSVFEETEAAREVVTALIDARLLTSYDVVDATGGEEGRQRVEIVHESLLAAWPRLVKWRTQDEDGALLRDQLRQAAKTWDERGRSDELLWTGSAYLDFCAWRERYAGGLSDVEERFARAMVAHAERRRRNRRIAAAVAFVVLLVVLGVISGLWRDADRAKRQSDVARQAAETEKGRAEASKLVALGQNMLEEFPSAALAYALASLELSDSQEARLLALDALSNTPAANVIGSGGLWCQDFSDDGEQLAVGWQGGSVKLLRQDGTLLSNFPGHGKAVGDVLFAKGHELLVTVGGDETLALWSLPTADLVARSPVRFPTGEVRALSSLIVQHGDRLLMIGSDNGDAVLESWTLDGRHQRVLRRLPAASRYALAVDSTGSFVGLAEDNIVRMLQLDGLEVTGNTLIGLHDSLITRVVFHPDNDWIAAGDNDGEIRLWSLESGHHEPIRVMRGQERIDSLAISPGGSTLASVSVDDARVWDLRGPPGADPVILRLGEAAYQMMAVSFHPSGNWIATGHFGSSTTALWPVTRNYPRVLRGHTKAIHGVAFSPDGSSLVSTASDGTARLWSLRAGSAQEDRLLLSGRGSLARASWSPTGTHVFTGSMTDGTNWLIPMEDGTPVELPGFTASAKASAFDPTGRFAAAAGGLNTDEDAVIRIWDLETGQTRVLDAGDGTQILDITFTADGRYVLSASVRGARIWDLSTSTSRELGERRNVWSIDVEPNGRYALTSGGMISGGPVVLHDLLEGSSRTLSAHGDMVTLVAFSADGRLVVSGDAVGVVRVGTIDAEDVHQLRGHEDRIHELAVHPGGEWIASGSMDNTVRLWPIPEGRPFHTRPYREIIETIKRLTNYRIVEDAAERSGYRLETAPFPGWETVPEW